MILDVVDYAVCQRCGTPYEHTDHRRALPHGVDDCARAIRLDEAKLDDIQHDADRRADIATLALVAEVRRLRQAARAFLDTLQGHGGDAAAADVVRAEVVLRDALAALGGEP